jgi:hypothetical protein
VYSYAIALTEMLGNSMGLILEARRHLFESVAYGKRLETADVLSKGPDSCVGIGGIVGVVHMMTYQSIESSTETA